MATMLVTGLDAQSPRQKNRQGGPEFSQRQGRMAQQYFLDLSEEQQEEMITLRTENYKTLKPLQNKMAELKARERTLLSEEDVDMKAVNKGIDEQTDLMNKIRKLQVEHKVNVKSILTDEQIMKMGQRSKFAKHRRSHGNDFNRPFQKGRSQQRIVG